MGLNSYQRGVLAAYAERAGASPVAVEVWRSGAKDWETARAVRKHMEQFSSGVDKPFLLLLGETGTGKTTAAVVGVLEALEEDWGREPARKATLEQRVSMELERELRQRGATGLSPERMAAARANLLRLRELEQALRCYPAKVRQEAQRVLGSERLMRDRGIHLEGLYGFDLFEAEKNRAEVVDALHERLAEEAGHGEPKPYPSIPSLAFRKAVQLSRLGIYGREASEELEQLKSVQILVLDDLGTDFRPREGSPWDAILFEIIDARYERSLLTVLTGNGKYEELRPRMDDRVRRRLHESGTRLEFWNKGGGR